MLKKDSWVERPWSVSKKFRNQQRLANSKRKARWFEQRRLQNDREVRLDAIEDLRVAFGASLETLDSDDDDRKLRDFASFLEDLRNDLSLIQTKANSTSGGEMKALMAEEKQLRRKLTEITGIVAVLAAAKRAKAEEKCRSHPFVCLTGKWRPYRLNKNPMLQTTRGFL